MEKTENKAQNDIKLGQATRVRNVIRYCNSIIKEHNFRELHFSAVGGAIGKLVSTVEVLRIVNPGFFQVNKIGTVSYQTVDNSGSVMNQKLYPKLEVLLTLDEPTEKTEGFQPKLSEEERTQLFELHSQRLYGEAGPRGEMGEGEEFRGAPRGGEMGEREFRGGFRGQPRGGFRGAPRGGFRGAPRGGFRGASRGGFYGQPRGGFRGAPRGGFRGASRGGFYGQPRGGFRGASRGGFRGNSDRTDSFRGRGKPQYY